MNVEDISIRVPTRGRPHAQTVMQLNAIRDANPGLPGIVYHPGSWSVARTRNEIVDHFLNTTARVLFMVDDDVVPHPNFLSMADSLHEYALVGAPYPFRSREHKTAWAVFDKEYMPIQHHQGEALTEVGSIGLGCVCIARSTLDLFIPEPFVMNRDWNEDIYFCYSLRKAGMRIGCRWDCVADHFSEVSLGDISNARG